MSGNGTATDLPLEEMPHGDGARFNRTDELLERQGL